MSKDSRVRDLEAQIAQLQDTISNQTQLLEEHRVLKENIKTAVTDTGHKEQDQRNLISELKKQIEQLNREVAVKTGHFSQGNDLWVTEESLENSPQELKKRLEELSFKNEVLQLEINKLTERHILKDQEHEAQLKIWNRERESFIYQIEQLKAQLSETEDRTESMERYIFSPGVDLVGDIDISQKEIEILKI